MDPITAGIQLINQGAGIYANNQRIREQRYSKLPSQFNPLERQNNDIWILIVLVVLIVVLAIIYLKK
jgi:hypothetical protein